MIELLSIVNILTTTITHGLREKCDEANENHSVAMSEDRIRNMELDLETRDTFLRQKSDEDIILEDVYPCVCPTRLL